MLYNFLCKDCILLFVKTTFEVKHINKKSVPKAKINVLSSTKLHILVNICYVKCLYGLTTYGGTYRPTGSKKQLCAV